MTQPISPQKIQGVNSQQAVIASWRSHHVGECCALILPDETGEVFRRSGWSW
jgi:hypothetical protein